MGASSCGGRVTTTSVVIEEVLNSAVVASELSQIDSVYNLKFVYVSKQQLGGSNLKFGDMEILVKHDRDILKKTENHLFNKRNYELVLVSVEEGKEQAKVDFYHPNSGLLISSSVKVSKRGVKIMETKVMSV